MNRLSALCVPLLAAGFTLSITACENMHPNNIPATSMLGTEGNGTVVATAQHSGTVYVYDVGADRIDYSGPVIRGDTVTVNTDSNEIMINSIPKATKTLNTGNKHRIYFDSTGSSTM